MNSTDNNFPRSQENYNKQFNVIPLNDDGTKIDGQTAQRQQQSGLQPGNLIRNPQDEIQTWITSINKDLLVPKIFYFFFFSAFGSLFPLMAVYFKQLGMNAVQTGSLIGIRPFIEFMSAPFWSSLADRFRKCKVMLLMSLFCWIVFTLALAYIRPPASACVIFNATHHILYTPYSNLNEIDEKPKEETSQNENEYGNEDTNRDLDETNKDYWPGHQTGHHQAPPNYVVGKSPLTVDYTLNYNQEKHISYVSPSFSSIVYKLDDVKEVFFLLLLLIILGEFFSAPAITLADCATLTYLGDDSDAYGRQRMFGSVGWGITMFIVGMALDNSTKFSGHPCGPHLGERNYRTCFTIFSFLMGISFVVATQFHFEYDSIGSNEQTSNDPNNIPLKPFIVEPGPKSIFNTAPPINKPSSGPPERKFEFIDKWKSAVFAQRTREAPEWVTVLKSFANVRYGMFLFVTWFLGFGIGLVFTFLFWHLQDLGGTPTLFGWASVINHISEICAYFYSIKFIKQFGHTKILCVGLAGNCARFLYISWLENPWWVLPFELIQGVTHAACYAACCSYVNHLAYNLPELKSSVQGVMQGIHHGLGRGCGAIIGGIFVNLWGTQTTFRLYGLCSLIVLALFAHINYYKRGQGYGFFEEDKDDIKIEDSSAFAPHGVPSNPIAKSLSRHDFTEMNGPQQQQQQTINPFVNDTETNYFLEPSHQWNPNQRNPFANGSSNYNQDNDDQLSFTVHQQQPQDEHTSYAW